MRDLHAKTRSIAASRTLAAAYLAGGFLVSGSLAPARANDYPTVAVADYVLGCMAANGETATVLRQCACSIDLVASLLSYDDYTQAETVLRMRQVAGDDEKMAIFRETTATKVMVDRLRRAQVDAEVRCFY
ncbi:hypothetical protein [Breoghania sp.]|uniref:hypothetical protein n=1 Tax=Breoghania sp. TaxID=2065378 RepID=UPI00260164E6|nr:hypothetical protein [Breoghania sp.]MDJ0931727.1 hypothetical protein [Breoghania sp.]